MKTVWGQPHKGSNPFLSAIYIYTFKDTAIGVLKAVNKIIYHTAEQVQLLRCDNIQFDRRFVTFDFDASETNYSNTATFGIRPFFAR